jgi:hypothetical protein
MTEGLRIDVPLADVRAATAAYVKEAETYIDPWTAARRVASAVRFDLGRGGREAEHAWERLRRQVAAELNRLAATGTLVKVSAGELTPDGRRMPGNQSRFYTHAGYEHAARRAADHAAAQSARRDHAEAVCARLRALCIPANLAGWDRVSLDLDHWDILLDLAEKGAGR